MKVRESGMPEELTWSDFFDVRGIMKKINIEPYHYGIVMEKRK